MYDQSTGDRKYFLSRVGGPKGKEKRSRGDTAERLDTLKFDTLSRAYMCVYRVHNISIINTTQNPGDVDSSKFKTLLKHFINLF